MTFRGKIKRPKVEVFGKQRMCYRRDSKPHLISHWQEERALQSFHLVPFSEKQKKHITRVLRKVHGSSEISHQGCKVLGDISHGGDFSVAEGEPSISAFFQCSLEETLVRERKTHFFKYSVFL